MKSDSFSRSISSSFLSQIASALQKQALPQQRAAWRIRWIERFVKFSVEQGDATSFEGLRTRFCESLATARSVTPWGLGAWLHREFSRA
jgi:hypothetical protein